jgi:hypothetical protein
MRMRLKKRANAFPKARGGRSRCSGKRFTHSKREITDAQPIVSVAQQPEATQKAGEVPSWSLRRQRMPSSALAACTGPAASVHAVQGLFAVQSSGGGRSLSAVEGPYVRIWLMLISGCGIADVDEPLAYGVAPSPTTENGPQ